jgi:hypothetical protein
VRHLLPWGVAIPVIYFAIQIAAAPFYPGYSFLSRDASTLGSAGSSAPWIFNVGTLVFGVVQAALAAALLSALPRAGIGRGLATVTAVALASAALGSLNAFLHPLPDPRHAGGWLAALGSGLALMPALTTAVLWRLGARRHAVAIGLLYLALIPVMTGVTQRACIWTGRECAGYQYFLNNYHGLVQRVGALAVFVPIGFVAHLLRPPARGAMPVTPLRPPADPR